MPKFATTENHEKLKNKAHDAIKKHRNGISREKLFKEMDINVEDDQQTKQMWQLNSALIGLQHSAHIEPFMVGESIWYKTSLQ